MLAAICVIGGLFLSGCATVPADKPLQDSAYTLYGETVAAYRDVSPGNYSGRKEFYKKAFTQIDLMEMRARIDVEAPFDDEEQLSKLQSSYVKPIQDLRTALKTAEESDQDDAFVRGKNLEEAQKELKRCFFAIIYRQTVGGPK